ncbi:FmdB family zinc ribbon protein [Kytococcus sedentarius]|uniref:FmdB family zinc ribbon protein n=1 Tax=Kytococcus sedentarius TaxID=1276 RepID=UPI0035BBC82D
MPLYDIRCEAQHHTELRIPLSQADAPLTCPTCGSDARRLPSSPGLGRSQSTAGRLIDSTRATAHTPGVVDAVPPGRAQRATPVSRDPRHAKLPRP